jgi:spore maturation protein CgeB
MKLLIVDTYYPAFVAACYRAAPELAALSYERQLAHLLDQCFGTSDYYSRHLNALGVETRDLIVNCEPLQRAFAQEAGLHASPAAALPLIGRFFAQAPTLTDILFAQIRAFRPDVLYCQDIGHFSPEVLHRLRREVRLFVGQIACPLPPDESLQAFDLILTSFPHYVPRLRAKGVASEYFRIGFDPKASERLGPVKKDVDVSFVGGISPHHGGALPLFEYLARETPIRFRGYGAETLDPASPIRARHDGEAWGLEMYRALARSRITLNRHIDVAENNANNMRLYEATGMGALLVTDAKDNLSQLFDVGREVVAYSSKEEAAELINHYLAHSDEAEKIARAGQARTLAEHSYRHRMEELAPMLERHLEGARA